VTIDYGLRTTDNGQRTIRFEVEDTGPGIPSDQLAQIFQPFEQGGELTRRAGGAGLGLAISRQLVRLMGDDIQVRSEAGRGSTFWFELTVPVVEAIVAAPAPAQIVTGYRGPQRKVLVVDDIAENRAVLVDLLTGLGFAVVEAANGQEGVEQAQAQWPDLILMDRTMPVLDGLETMHHLRQLPLFYQTPIIAVSASVAGPDREQSLAAGASAFVPKPIHQEELLQQIGRLLQLTWVYEQPTAIPTDAEPPQVGLPPEEAKLLYKLAQQGWIQEIQQRLDVLEQRGPEHRAIVAELRQLARRYRLRSIRALLEPYVQKGSDGSGEA
jgi:CheY-like chemotaxis protein